MEKSHVSMDTKICPVCGIKHDVGISLERQLKNKLDIHNITGYELCEEHKKLWEDGYVALIEIDPTKSVQHESNNNEFFTTVNMQDAYRTGNILHLKKTAFKDIFGSEPKSEMVFIDPDLTKVLTDLVNKNKQEEV